MLCVRELDVAAETSLPEAAADLEHSPHGSGRFRQRLVSDEESTAYPDGAGRGQCEHKSEQPEEAARRAPSDSRVGVRASARAANGPARERPGEEAEAAASGIRCRGVQELVIA